MNFADVLVGSLVFSLASGSSLQLTARMGQSLLEQRRQAERMEQIDLALVAGEQALRQAAAQRPSPDPACADPAALLVSLLQEAPATPLAAGLQRQVAAVGDRQVSLGIVGGGPGLDRRRLFTPAAYGLCPPLPAASQVLAAAPASPAPSEPLP